MKIQSLSVVVPAKKCVNDCKFCVSKMHESEYEDMTKVGNTYYDLYKKDFKSRMEFARDNGCNTVMLTGDCEPLQNRQFLARFGDVNQSLKNPFKVIEIQTAGNLLTDKYLYFLRHHVGVTTISLSVNSLRDDATNCGIMGTEKHFNLRHLCSKIKQYRFNLRLSLNVSRHLAGSEPILNQCQSLGADQVTFRKLYSHNPDDFTIEQNEWVEKNKLSESWWKELDDDIKLIGKLLDKLEYGREKYEYMGMSIVVDNDCMSQESKDVAKYLILREDCKLYSRWETKASLIF